MKKDKIITTLSSIFQSVFKSQDIPLTIDSSPENTLGWDSLNHILFIIEIEKEYSIKFTAGEVVSNKTINQICNSIISKLNKKQNL